MSGNNILVKITAVIITLNGIINTASAISYLLDESKMYWVNYNEGKVMRANLDGSAVEELVVGLDHPSDIAVDLTGGKIYWTVTSYGPGKIQRANLDGSGVEDLVTGGLLGPIGIDIDIDNEHVYWVDPYADRIQRANFDGSDVVDAVQISGTFTYPYDIALDISGGKIYWTDWGTDKVQRANMDGSAIQDLVISGLSYPCGIVLDESGGKIFWTDYGSDSIKCANLDGTGVENIITSGLSEPTGIDLDLGAGKIYIVDYKGSILRSNMDGSELETLISGLRGPWDIDLAIISEFVIQAYIEIEPNTLNLKSKGKWITCHIWLPEDYNVADVDPNSIQLGNEPNALAADWTWFEEEEEFVMAKFSRLALQEMLAALETPTQVELLITGELADGTVFEGTDTITVIDKGKKK